MALGALNQNTRRQYTIDGLTSKKCPALPKFLFALLVNPLLLACHGGCSMKWFPVNQKEQSTMTSVDGAELAKRREQMVRDQLQARDISDSHVLKAMLQVPRHEFVPVEFVGSAYEDNALPLKNGQTISQPYIVAYMTQALELQGTERVLEIGTGSGYQAAVLAEIVREVYSIEILPELQKQASAVLLKLGYRNIHFKVGDGYMGWPEHSPFDRIIVTAAPEFIPRPLIEQLKEGGRMIIPVGTLNQELIVLEKTKSGITQRSTIPVRFVPMTGKAQERQ
jgi:protein-L-isoaspartate(D-aspartate) O-methyltransferase